MERIKKMKLTTKILKEMIRKELKEARDPLKKQGGYFGRGLAYDPEQEKENEKMLAKLRQQSAADKDPEIAIQKIIKAIEDYDDRFGAQGGNLDPEEESVQELKNFIESGALDAFDDEQIKQMWADAYNQWLDM